MVLGGSILLCARFPCTLFSAQQNQFPFQGVLLSATLPELVPSANSSSEAKRAPCGCLRLVRALSGRLTCMVRLNFDRVSASCAYLTCPHHHPPANNTPPCLCVGCLSPRPLTLNPQSSTLDPQPSTLNPQPSTLYPQP